MCNALNFNHCQAWVLVHLQSLSPRSKLKKRTRAYVIIQMHPQPTTLTTFLGGGSRRKYKEMVVEGRGPKVQESKVPRAQGPRYLKVTLKYGLDS